MNTILAKAEQTHQLTEAELVRLLTDPDAAVPLYAAADRVRQKYVGDQVELRGLIEFSNICKQNCLYCGLRRDNRQIPRYRLDGETILEFGRRAAELGYKTLVMQSGEDEAFSPERLAPVLTELKKLGASVRSRGRNTPRCVRPAPIAICCGSRRPTKPCMKSWIQE